MEELNLFNYSSKIKNLRESAGLSSSKLSSELGMTSSTISAIEIGKNLPSLQLLEKICDYFEISLSEFFAEEDESKNKSDLSNEEQYILKLWNGSDEDTKMLVKSYLKNEKIHQSLETDDIAMLMAYKKASPAEKTAIDALLNQYKDKDIPLQKHA